MSRNKVEEIKQQIEALKKRWPAHSVPPALMMELDELEELLWREEAESEEPGEGAGIPGQVFQVQAIGRVENTFHEPAAPEEIKTKESRLVIDPSLEEGLLGLEPGQQMMVIFFFHRSEGFDIHQHPRGDPSRPKRGVFALRTPNRPNSIGVTVVDLIAVEGNVLRVSGLDAINGTPILDLKPA